MNEVKTISQNNDTLPVLLYIIKKPNQAQSDDVAIIEVFAQAETSYLAWV